MIRARLLRAGPRRPAAIALALLAVARVASCGNSGSKPAGSSTAANAIMRYGANSPLVTFDPAKAQAGGDARL